jgi:proteic killer suppression protein
MIKSFRDKELAKLWSTGASKIDKRMHGRIAVRLDRLNVVDKAEDLNHPGYDFHALKGFKPTRYTIHVNGPWCITFEFEGGDAFNVDFEQYH